MSTIEPAVYSEITTCLANIEREHEVKILYACESGSRAWGFESPDSDYDVRFIYARPQDWYVSIDVERKRDVIELPIDDLLDVNGWDVRKALQLFHKSNPPLNEWLVSPIVYMKRGDLAERLRELMPTAFNPIAAHYHYLRMAENTYRAYLKGDMVRRKKYLYALRPLLAVNWIENGQGVVPIEFDRLVAGTVSDPSLLSEIAELLRVKRANAESGEGPRFNVIHDFVDREMARHAGRQCKAEISRASLDELNELFRLAISDNE